MHEKLQIMCGKMNMHDMNIGKFFFVTWEGLREFMSCNQTVWCIYWNPRHCYM